MEQVLKTPVRNVQETDIVSSPKTSVAVTDEGEYEDNSLPEAEFRGIDVEFANEKLQRIENHFLKLSKIMSGITPRFFKENRDKFDELAMTADEHMRAIRAQLVTFSAKVKSEYTTAPFSWRIILWFLAFFSARARRTSNAVRHSRQQRSALLEAAVKYETFLDQCQEDIDKIRFARIRTRQNELLMQSEEYQKNMLNINSRHILQDVGYNSIRKAEIDGLERRQKQLKTSAYQQALRELGEDMS